VFNQICDDYRQFASGLELLDGNSVHFVPMSALKGDKSSTAASAAPGTCGRR